MKVYSLSGIQGKADIWKDSIIFSRIDDLIINSVEFTNDDLFNIFTDVNGIYFDGELDDINIVFSNRMKKTLGTFHSTLNGFTGISKAKEIRIGTNNGNVFTLVDTIKHEMIHYYLCHKNSKTAHNQEFKLHCARIRSTYRGRRFLLTAGVFDGLVDYYNYQLNDYDLVMLEYIENGDITKLRKLGGI